RAPDSPAPRGPRRCYSSPRVGPRGGRGRGSSARRRAGRRAGPRPARWRPRARPRGSAARSPDEQPARAGHEDDEEDDEPHDLAIGATERGSAHRLGQAEPEAADGEDGTGIARGDRALVRREETHGRRLERQRQPEADEEGVLDTRLLGRAHDPPEERPVEDDAGDERGGDDDRERREGVESPEREEPEGAVAAEHDQLAVGDVEHLEDAEDQGEAGGGEPVEPAEEEPEDQLLEERAHGAKGPR